MTIPKVSHAKHPYRGSGPKIVDYDFGIKAHLDDPYPILKSVRPQLRDWIKEWNDFQDRKDLLDFWGGYFEYERRRYFMRFFRWIAKIWRSEAGQIAREIISLGPEAIDLIRTILKAAKDGKITRAEFDEIVRKLRALIGNVY